MNWEAFYLNQAAEDSRLVYERYRFPGYPFLREAANAPSEVPSSSSQGPCQLPPGDSSPPTPAPGKP